MNHPVLFGSQSHNGTSTPQSLSSSLPAIERRDSPGCEAKGTGKAATLTSGKGWVFKNSPGLIYADFSGNETWLAGKPPFRSRILTQTPICITYIGPSIEK